MNPRFRSLLLTPVLLTAAAAYAQQAPPPPATTSPTPAAQAVPTPPAAGATPSAGLLPDSPGANITPAPQPTGPTAVFDTSMGQMRCKLFEKEAPQTVANFVGLATGTKDWTNPATHEKERASRFTTGPPSTASSPGS